jgi:hypothetical protein
MPAHAPLASDLSAPMLRVWPASSKTHALTWQSSLHSMLDKSKRILHKDSHKWDDQHQCERDRPINPRLQETDIDKSAQKKN